MGGHLSQGHGHSKCGISVAIDGSEDTEINIVGLEDYVVGDSEDEATDDDADPSEDLD